MCNICNITFSLPESIDLGAGPEFICEVAIDVSFKVICLARTGV